MIATIVTIYVKKENISEFVAATLENCKASVQEPGNLRFDLIQCDDEPLRFVLYEAYQTEEAAKAHKETAHYKKWKDAVANWMAKPREGVKHTILFPQK